MDLYSQGKMEAQGKMRTGLELKIFSMDCMNFYFAIYIRDSVPRCAH